jgi:hypothetical protein
VQLDQELVLAAIREPGQRAPPALDRLSRDGLDRLCAERRQQVRVERRAVVAQRREAWLREVLDEARRGTLPGMLRTGAIFADAAAEWLRFIEEDRERKPSAVRLV